MESNEADNFQLQDEEIFGNNSNNEEGIDSSHYMSTDESSNSTEIMSPGGSIFWIPEVEKEIEPVVGKVYGSLEKCIEMYEIYADKGGFGTRLSTQKKTKSGFIFLKYILCSKEGMPDDINYNTLDKENSGKQVRNKNLQVTGCRARAIFKQVPGTSNLYLEKFEEKHNHPLIAKEYKHLSRKNRQLTHSERSFICKAGTSNMGATKAHHLFTAIRGSYAAVNGTTVDFKNFKRDINCYIGDSDSQMLINKMENRKKYVPNFSFEYKVENGELAAMFWADEIAQLNYKEFGDIISFDATFRTNKYCMVFVPFTGIDNHKKCVSLGAGMLRNETADTYKWLLKAFLKAFIKQPRIVVTDQDPAMKKAVASIFYESQHRLCMWHITNKLPAKIVAKILDETDFKSRLNKIIWNVFITPLKFEEKWTSLIEEFNLKDNKWLSDMFEIRSTWIPAYFIESPMCGLMRTTSRSESENSFFSNFTNSSSTLVNFMISFESAMERQRHRQEVLDHHTMTTGPTFETPLNIERHASKVYTRTIFLIVQKEIYASAWLCSQKSTNTEEGCDVAIIKEKRPNIKKKANDSTTVSEEQNNTAAIPEKKKDFEFKVIHNTDDDSVVCSCMFFVRFGILCRHIFCVFQNCDIEEIPERYILRRWRRNIIPAHLRNKRERYGETNEECDRLANEAFSTIDYCLGILSNDETKLASFVEKVKKLKTDVEAEYPNLKPLKKQKFIENMLGVSIPDKIEVANATAIRTKGTGKDTRMRGAAEIAIQARIKAPRLCGRCGILTNEHDKRNCKKKEEEALARAAKIAAEKAEKRTK